MILNFTSSSLWLTPVDFLLPLVGEPINEEAWRWYNDVVGNKHCTVVDTWWQTGMNYNVKQILQLFKLYNNFIMTENVWNTYMYNIWRF